jgi:hypothetical protein
MALLMLVGSVLVLGCCDVPRKYYTEPITLAQIEQRLDLKFPPDAELVQAEAYHALRSTDLFVKVRMTKPDADAFLRKAKAEVVEKSALPAEVMPRDPPAWWVRPTEGRFTDAMFSRSGYSVEVLVSNTADATGKHNCYLACHLGD